VCPESRCHSRRIFVAITKESAIKILLTTPLLADLIRKGEIYKLKALMKYSREHGMRAFAQALYDLCSAGKISYEDALNSVDSQNEVRLMIKLGTAHASNLNVDTVTLTDPKIACIK
jgi:twitching motility protein PilU